MPQKAVIAGGGRSDLVAQQFPRQALACLELQGEGSRSDCKSGFTEPDCIEHWYILGAEPALRNGCVSPDPNSRVEILFNPGCPNLTLARERVRCAMVSVGLDPAWAEGPCGDSGYGSPTVLVDGADVFGVGSGCGESCRLYPADSGLEGAPSVESIVAALRR